MKWIILGYSLILPQELDFLGGGEGLGNIAQINSFSRKNFVLVNGSLSPE